MATKVLPLSLIFSAFLSFSSVTAVQLDLLGKRRHPLFRKRDESGTFGNGSLALRNEGDLSYFCNVTLGGRDFEVIIDTGSVDLWVSGSVPGTKDTGVPMSISFAKGEVAGNINTAQLEFDGFTIEDQAYLRADTAQDVGDTDGVLGLGPSSASDVVRLLNSSAGDPPLDRIFKQNMNTPNFMTFLLSRDGGAEGSDSVEGYPAQLTIGTVTSGLEAILDAPKLPALHDQFSPLAQHWLTLLDANGIIGPDGQRIQTQTSIPNPTAGTPDQLHVMFDSGFSIPQLPGYIVDAIYGKIPGAKFFADGSDLDPGLDGLENIYRIPCDYEVNVSFVFAGQEFPISPLDLSIDLEGQDRSGEEICIGFFQQIDSNIEGNSNFGALDMILGMGFLRNTYILFNFGDFVDGSADNVADPYIQLLSINDKAKNHADFVQARLNGKDNSGSVSVHGCRPINFALGISVVAALGMLFGY